MGFICEKFERNPSGCLEDMVDAIPDTHTFCEKGT